MVVLYGTYYYGVDVTSLFLKINREREKTIKNRRKEEKGKKKFFSLSSFDKKKNESSFETFTFKE